MLVLLAGAQQAASDLFTQIAAYGVYQRHCRAIAQHNFAVPQAVRSAANPLNLFPAQDYKLLAFLMMGIFT